MTVLNKMRTSSSDVEIQLNDLEFLSIYADYNSDSKNIYISCSVCDIDPKTGTVSTMLFTNKLSRFINIKKLARKNSKLIAKAKEELGKINHDVLLELLKNKDVVGLQALIQI
jgi:hypothetical protein